MLNFGLGLLVTALMKETYFIFKHKIKSQFENKIANEKKRPHCAWGYIKQPVNSSCMQGMGLRFPLRISSATQILSNT